MVMVVVEVAVRLAVVQLIVPMLVVVLEETMAPAALLELQTLAVAVEQVCVTQVEQFIQVPTVALDMYDFLGCNKEE
jgi:hypothetical protein